LSIGGYPQQIKGNFFVTGKVKVDQGVVDGTHLELYQNGVRIQDLVVNRTGSFRVPVDLGKVYRFTFSNTDYYSKTIEIDTHVPPEVMKDNSEFPPYQLTILLYRKVPGVNETSREIGKISYNPKTDNFDAEILRQEVDLSAMIASALTEVKQKSELYEEQATRDKKQKYDRLISEANSYFNARNYNQAMLSYRDAALIYPNESFPREKVDQMYQLLESEELAKAFGPPTEDNFLKYVNYGDAKFSEKEFTIARVAFENALKVKPDESKIQSRYQNSLDEIQKMKDVSRDEIVHRDQVYASRTVKYKELIAKGTVLFKNQDIVGAKDLFAQAATQIDENSYALLMLQKIGDISSNDELAIRLARERDEAEKKRLNDARNQAYNDAIAEADRQFNDRLYRDALENYELALTIKSYELYPKQQIIEINNILAKLQLNGEEYNRLLRDGDSKMQSKNYALARGSYSNAHDLIPDEKYALQKMAEIDRILEQLKKEGAFQEQYDKAIAEADNLFDQKKYTESIVSYQKASNLKPSESYPKDQILKIRGILSRESEDQKRLLQQQTDYDQAILQADIAFNKQSYQNARSLYQKALQIFPDQEYPSLQIKKIDDFLRLSTKTVSEKNILDQIDFSNLDNISKEDREAAYKEAMALGESFFKSKDWGVARFYFRRALSLFPNDDPAGKRLDETERMIRGNDVNESKYAEMVKKAEESFKTGDISVAKFYYSKALEAKPNDSFVKERLVVAEQLLKSTSEGNDNREFEDAMNKGNESFSKNNYILARFFYRKAISLKSDNQLAKDRLSLSEKALQQDKSETSNLDYNRNITLADQAFQQQKYGVAENYYRQALTIKPGEAYPLGQLSKIEGLIKN